MSDRFICIHAHFYQPPREHPWLETIEGQDSAHPYHDWNERITAECYRPNMHARILDEKGRVTKIVNNYARVNFNFGPTLLSWMQESAPDVYEGILQADKESLALFSGHGSAIAQVYNHIILPLANSRDKETQIIWGLKDFEARFKRKSEGMWLAETAVDSESLELLAKHEIKYTILAPRQAKAIRSLQGGEWTDVSGEKIDPRRAYRVNLPSGRFIDVFFYDGPISKGVAFEKLLENGERFAGRLTGAFTDSPETQLVHIATDGETYGHHHKHGEMALAYALEHIESKTQAKVTTYGKYLAEFPPEYEAQIFEDSSWSCAHGVERWKADCGCASGMEPTFNQKWRAPVRDSLNWLRDQLNPKFEAAAREYFEDPWRARNEYITLMLDRSEDTIEEFFKKFAKPGFDKTTLSRALKLLELERHALYMFTSCGWFFDDLTGIETVQNLHYAGRVVKLAEDLFQEPVEAEFLNRLSGARSNVPAYGDGRQVYERFVKPGEVNLLRVAAHYAVSSLFENYGEFTPIFAFNVQLIESQNFGTGLRLSIGHGKVTSNITLESSEFSYGILYFGDHNLHAGVCPYAGPEAYQKMLLEASNDFVHADFPNVIRTLDRHFGASTFSLKSLFGDEQRKILQEVLKSTLATVENTYSQIYKTHYPLITYLTDIHNPLVKKFQPILEFMKNKELEEAFIGETNPASVDKILREAKDWNVRLDSVQISRTLQSTLEDRARRFGWSHTIEDMRSLLETVLLAKKLPFPVELWKVQDIYYDLLQGEYEKRVNEEPTAGSAEWLKEFRLLGAEILVKVPE